MLSIFLVTLLILLILILIFLIHTINLSQSVNEGFDQRVAEVHIPVEGVPTTEQPKDALIERLVSLTVQAGMQAMQIKKLMECPDHQIVHRHQLCKDLRETIAVRDRLIRESQTVSLKHSREVIMLAANRLHLSEESLQHMIFEAVSRC